MMKKTFVCDVDSVLLDMDFVLKMCISSLYQIPGVGMWSRLEQRGPKHWEIEEAYGIPRSALDKIWTECWNTECKPMNGALDFLVALRKLGVTTIACSSRKPGAAAEALQRDIQPLLPGLDGVMAVNGGSRKAKAIKDAGIVPSWFMDDRSANVYDFLDGWPGCRILLFDQPWNQALDLDPPYTRVKTYQHVLNLVKGELESR